MAIAQYCNLRRPDIVPVVLGFNYEANNTPAATFACTHQISAQSNNTWQSYCDLTMSTLDAVRHLGFYWKCIFTTLRPPEILVRQLQNFNKIGQCVVESLTIQHILVASFSGGELVVPFCQRWATELHRILTGHRAIIAALRVEDFGRKSRPKKFGIFTHEKIKEAAE